MLIPLYVWYTVHTTICEHSRDLEIAIFRVLKKRVTIVQLR